ncbi:MAG: ComF family protein, partial [Paludibacteraceae bacterium]|nr:ComF family protein [Paludibacteraceae bacterium]
IENPTQTKKSVYERWENTNGIFDIHDSSRFEGKHILLIDDVLTTGSTIIACAQALQKTKNIKISVFTLATA